MTCKIENSRLKIEIIEDYFIKVSYSLEKQSVVATTAGATLS